MRGDELMEHEFEKKLCFAINDFNEVFLKTLLFAKVE